MGFVPQLTDRLSNGLQHFICFKIYNLYSESFNHSSTTLSSIGQGNPKWRLVWWSDLLTTKKPFFNISETSSLMLGTLLANYQVQLGQHWHGWAKFTLSKLDGAWIGHGCYITKFLQYKYKLKAVVLRPQESH